MDIALNSWFLDIVLEVRPNIHCDFLSSALRNSFFVRPFIHIPRVFFLGFIVRLKSPGINEDRLRQGVEASVTGYGVGYARGYLLKTAWDYSLDRTRRISPHHYSIFPYSFLQGVRLFGNRSELLE